MGKAEEKLQSRYSTLAEKFAFIDGYEQAEEDNELTWEDIKNIDTILLNLGDCDLKEKEYYREVLKQFNKERKEK